MNPERVLFIQLKRLGDILMITPAIRAFKKKYPSACLDVAVEPPGDILLKYNPYVDDIIIFQHKSWLNLLSQYKIIKTMRAKRYDLAVDFLGNPRSAHFTYLSGARQRIGYSNVRFKYAYNKLVNAGDSYSALSKLKMLDFIGIDSTDHRLEFNLDPQVKLPQDICCFRNKNMIAISPVSRNKQRMWPLDQYAGLVDLISAKFDVHCIVIVGPGESNILNVLRDMIKSPCSFIQIVDLMQLGVVLKTCRLLIGNDNGPKHIAAAVGIPTFTIYHQTKNPYAWTDPNYQRHRFMGGKNQSVIIRLSEITLDSVEKAAVDFMIDLGLIKHENPSAD